MDYFSILNLNKEPFSNSPDPEFFFHSRQHIDCLQKLELSLLLRRGLNVIIGDVGTGKTTMCRQLIRRFSQKDEMETYLILDPHFLFAADFLTTVATLLRGKKIPGGRPEWQIKEYIKQLLFRKGVEHGKTIILIIDEGQKIPAFCLEILREFLNYETNEYKLLQIVIFAQREFEKTIRRYPNFADRISLYHLMKPLSFRDTRRMIKFRLQKSSNSRQKMSVFTYPAMWAIFRISGGYPRKIINLCHQSILAMIIQSRSRSGYFLVKRCARRLFPEQLRRKKIFFAVAFMGGAAAVILLILITLDRFIALQSPESLVIRPEFSLKTAEKKSIPNPIDEPPSANAGSAPEDFSIPETIETESKPPAPAGTAGPGLDDRSAGEIPQTAAVDNTIQEVQPPSILKTTHAEILGRITLQQEETLSRIIKQVYGDFNSDYLKAFNKANPGIEDPDRVEIGQRIVLPAIPAQVTPGDERLRWIKVNETETLEEAFKIMRNYPDSFPPVRLIPYWNPSNGTRFALVLDKVFKDEQSARNQRERLPVELSPNSAILSLREKKTIYFANPYFNGGD